MGNIVNSYIDTLFVKNRTSNSVTLGDLVNCEIPGNKTIDLLKVPRVTKDKINQSEHLRQAVNAGILRIIKPKPSARTFQEQEMILPDYEDIQSLNKTSQTKSVFISGPTASESIVIWYTEKPITITEIRGVTDLGTTTFNINIADSDVAFGSATSVNSSPIIADTDGQIQSGFTDASIPIGKWISLETTAIGGGVTKFNATISYQAT